MKEYVVFVLFALFLTGIGAGTIYLVLCWASNF